MSLPDATHSSPAETCIGAEKNGAVLRLTLNNPPANALSVAVIEKLLRELERAREERSIRVIILAAKGKLFSAGHDLKELTAHRSDPDGGEEFFAHTFALCGRLMQALVRLPKPIIAEIDGIATAAGCQLVASCDIAMASERALFGVNGINVGLFCTSPSVALTRLVSRKRAMQMLLTGEMIDAETACDFGLINRVVPRASLRAAVDELAGVIAAKSPYAIELGKIAMADEASMALAQAYEHAGSVMVRNLLAADASAGIGAFLQGRGRK